MQNNAYEELAFKSRSRSVPYYERPFSLFSLLVAARAAVLCGDCPLYSEKARRSRRAMTDTLNSGQLSLISATGFPPRDPKGFPLLSTLPPPLPPRSRPFPHREALRRDVLPRRARTTSPGALRWCLCSLHNEFSKFCRGC